VHSFRQVLVFIMTPAFQPNIRLFSGGVKGGLQEGNNFLTN